MLYQDRLTGMLHEVPDSQVNGYGLAEDPYSVGEGQMVYDGLGNPLGWGFLKKLVKKGTALCHIHTWTLRAVNQPCASNGSQRSLSLRRLRRGPAPIGPRRVRACR